MQFLVCFRFKSVNSPYSKITQYTPQDDGPLAADVAGLPRAVVQAAAAPAARGRPDQAQVLRRRQVQRQLVRAFQGGTLQARGTLARDGTSEIAQVLL